MFLSIKKIIEIIYDVLMYFVLKKIKLKLFIRYLLL